jgi:hypothetical protein
MLIEDVVLSHDRRGISALRGYLPARFCEEAAVFVLGKKTEGRRPAVITTGFYVARAAAPETDGPPGALALGGALRSLGFDVIYVTDRHTLPLLPADLAGEDRVIDFPIADHDSSRRFARHLLDEVQPCLLVSIERPGFNVDHRYVNMAGEDITEHTAKIDYLFLNRSDTVGIGDGGNEIGMGNLAQYVPTIQTLPRNPALTPVERLVIASVSNWGAYGLVAALSRLVGRNLLPSLQWEKDVIREVVARGAVDGVSGQRRPEVDGFDLEQNSWAIGQLHRVLAERSGCPE